MRVTSKAQMYRLLWDDAFGNHFRWESAQDWLYRKSQDNESYSLRFGKHLGAPWLYNVDREEALTVLSAAPIGYLDKISVVTKPIGIHELLQGEVTRSERYLDLHYSTLTGVPMRRALREQPRYAHGLEAVLILQSVMDTASWENLERLFVEYDNPVVEISVFSCCVGVLDQNTVVWEVRHY